MPTPIPTGGEVKVLFEKPTHHPIYKKYKLDHEQKTI
jgi:hypothetical protein